MRAWTMRWLAFGLCLLAACGGGTDETKAHVRLVNASGGYSALSLTIDDTAVASSVAYGATASYGDVDKGATDAELSQPGGATSLVGSTVALGKNKYFTMLAYGKSGSAAMQLIDDNQDTPASGKTLVRVINAAPDAGNLDVYLTSSATALADATAFQSAAAYGTLNGFVTTTSGTWRLRVTAAGSKSDLRLDVSGLSFGSEGVVTVVVTPGRGGVLVNALLLAQQGGITAAANTQARVRVVAGVSSGASVSASVGGTTLMTSGTAPSLTAYSLLTSGTLTVAASASGTAAALTSATVAGGGDYTLLVYGTPGAPVATLIEDDNSLPTDTTGAKLRLVHGLADVTGTLSLGVDYEVTADAVAQGAASAYAAVAASTTAYFTATSAGSTTALLDDHPTGTSTGTARSLLAGGVYTFFVVGDSGSPVGILRKDR